MSTRPFFPGARQNLTDWNFVGQTEVDLAILKEFRSKWKLNQQYNWKTKKT